MTIYRPGDTVIMRGTIGSRTGVAIPATVVQDDDDRTLVYVAPGTPCKRLVPAAGVSLPRVLRPEQIDDPSLHLIDSTWSETHLLHVTLAGRSHSIYVRWSDEWVFRGWYVNMQTPIERRGFVGESEDRYLDIVVDPDFTWRWKDEDELVEAVAVGRIGQGDADDARAEGERVLTELAARQWPFVPAIASWRPDPAWDIPSLPDNWDVGLSQ